MLFNCLVSRAVYIDLIEAYNTNSFLAAFKRFASIRGYPGTVYSDKGSQLVSADKELKELFNVNKVLQFGATQGMNWSFTKSSDAPWQNGCSEALIKSVKRSVTMIVGDTILTYGELQTLLFGIANLLNERPIGIKPGSDIELGTYLCPNDLILGRSSIAVPPGPMDESDQISKRLDFVDKVLNSFWKKWQRDYFPTLLVRQKWHHVKRNYRVGDIVLVQDSNTLRGKWKLAQVVKAEPGQDGIVRDVSVRYKIQKPGTSYQGNDFTEIKRSVHKLVVLLPVEECA